MWGVFLRARCVIKLPAERGRSAAVARTPRTIITLTRLGRTVCFNPWCACRSNSIVGRACGSVAASAARANIGGAASAVSGPHASKRWQRLLQALRCDITLQRVRQLIRGVRVAFLALVLYKVGVSAGLQRYALDPAGERSKLVHQVLTCQGALETKADGKVVYKLMDKDSTEVKAVRRVFPRVLKAALEETQSQKRKLQVAQAQGQGNGHSLHNKKLKVLDEAETQLMNWRPDDFLVLDVATPDAFVTAMVPRCVFVHRGLFKAGAFLALEDVSALQTGARLAVVLKEGVTYSMAGSKRTVIPETDLIYQCSFVVIQGKECVVRLLSNRKGDVLNDLQLHVDPSDLRSPWEYSIVETDEHLAMLLSHELAHVVHGHSVESTTLNAQTLGLQMVLLAVLDPTGIVSLLVEAFMGSALHYGVTLPHSREHEFEADGTGLRIMARALYDPRDAPIFFERMLEFSETVGSRQVPAWRSTHPGQQDRIKLLQAQEADAVKYYQHKMMQAGKAADIAEMAKPGQSILVWIPLIAILALALRP